MDIEDLILSGAVEPAGIDSETGEMLYSFTNKLKDVSPLLAREVDNMFNEHVMKLWEIGILRMNVMDENPIVRLTEKAFNKEIVEALDEDLKHTLKEIKRHVLR